MDGEEVPGYQPDDGFEQDTREPLLDLTGARSSSKELWLIQWPPHDVLFPSSSPAFLPSFSWFNQYGFGYNLQLPDIHGKEVCITFDRNGSSGSFEDLSGKKYDIVGTDVERDAAVFMSSVSETEIVGNISHRISLVHFPDPKEIEQRVAEKTSKRLYQMTSSKNNSSHHSSGVTGSSRLKNSTSSRGPAASTHTSREGPSASKRRHVQKSPGSKGGPSLDSKRRQSSSNYISGTSER
ncbi:unnamed protein product [Linum tenue]|uniref:Uncharacterized protein n=1 Tax=Linum tenue TaxID=586396 RepID=A0AAV0S077_9ROSI|nr:unnamed protein product [Linum tenue]CAI0623288.1 unnamed protein product [Linum tenue]